MPYQFKNYTADELETCGQCFCADFETQKFDTTPKRTFAVLEWFRRAAEPWRTIRDFRRGVKKLLIPNIV